MDESRCCSENLAQSQNDLASVEDISQRQVSQVIVWMYWFIQIFTIVAFVVWILAGVFKWGMFDIIGCIFLLLLVLSAIVSRSIAFYCRRISYLGFVTEMVFILGVVFLVLNLILGIEFGYMLAFFGILSFVVSPLLGIVRRVILIVRRETKSVRCTIAEMIILSIPAIIATWLLLRYFI